MDPITRIMLSIFGKDYPVISYNIGFTQNYNSNTGQIVGQPVGSLLDVSIVSDNETDFVEWMIGSSEQEEGAIEFYYDDQLVKSINFSEAYLVGYHQNMDEVKDTNGNKQRVISEDLSISYRIIEFDDISHDKLENQDA